MNKPEIRWDLVNHIREQIAAGTYDTDGMLRIAIERMLTGEREASPESPRQRPTTPSRGCQNPR